MDRRDSASADIARSIQQGLPPSNAQVAQVLENTKQVLEKEGGNTKVVKDLEAVIEDTERLIFEKNADQKLQRFILLTKELSEKAASAARTSGGVVDQEKLKRLETRAKDISNNFQSAITQLISSSDFRNLLSDFLALLKDAATEEARSRDTGLSQKAGEVKKVINQSLGTITRTSTPSTSTEKETPSDTTKLDLNQPFGAPILTTPSATPSVSMNVQTPSGKTLTELATETKGQLKEFVSGVSADVKQGTFAVSDKTKRALDERLREILDRIGNNRNFSRATLALLDLFDEMKQTTWEVKEQSEKKLEQSEYDILLRQIRDEAFGIIAEFTGKESLQLWLKDFWHFISAVQNDRELDRYFSDVRRYITEILERPAALKEQFYINRSKELVHRGTFLWSNFKEREHAESLLNEASFLLEIVKRDPSVARLSEDSKKLIQDSFYDARGRPSFAVTRESLDSLKRVVLPLIMENIQNIPIGRIEGFEENYWFALDDVTFSAQDLLPENVYLKFETDMSLDLKHLETKDAPAYLLRIEFRNINCRFHNVHFQFVKSNFPKLEDNGIADVDIRGITLILRWFSTAALGNALAFGLRRARCHIYDVNINIKAAHHDILLPTFVKFYEGTVRRRLEKVIESTLSTRMDSITNQINLLFNQATSQFSTTKLLDTASTKIQEAIQSTATNLSALNLQAK